MQGGEPGGAAAGLAEDPPGLQSGHAALDGIPEPGMGLVQRLLARGEFFAGPATSSGGEGGAGAEVAEVGQDRDAEPLAGADDTVFSGGGEVVGAPGQHP